MEFVYRTEGVCAKEINLTIDNGIIKKVDFIAGCNGNLQGISKLVEGMPIEAVITKLEGISCGSKATSCPDQLSKALKSIL
jgi:uncharacterized protein (TIGR03905 family)